MLRDLSVLKVIAKMKLNLTKLNLLNGRNIHNRNCSLPSILSMILYTVLFYVKTFLIIKFVSVFEIKIKFPCPCLQENPIFHNDIFRTKILSFVFFQVLIKLCFLKRHIIKQCYLLKRGYTTVTVTN